MVQTNKRGLSVRLSLNAQGRHFRRQRRGQTLVEYALIVSLIAVVAIGVLITLGQQTKSFYSVVSSKINAAAGS